MTKKLTTHLNYIIHSVECRSNCNDVALIRVPVSGAFFLECRCCHRHAYLPMDGTDWEWEYFHEECDERPLDPHIFDAWRAKVATLESELAKARQVQSADAAKWFEHYENRGRVIDRLSAEKENAEKLATQATQAQNSLTKELNDVAFHRDIAIELAKAQSKNVENRDAEINRLAHVANAATARSIKLSEENDRLQREWDVAHKANSDLLRKLDEEKNQNAVLLIAKDEMVSEVLDVRKLLAQAHVMFLEEHKKNAQLREANYRLVRWRQDFLDAEKKRWEPLVGLWL